MIKAGVTGGIGSGKTYVCKVFESLGIPVFYADEEARKISSLKEVNDQVIEAFGPSVTDPKRNIDRGKLALLVFSNPAELKKLNEIIHPLVQLKFEEWTKQHENKEYVIKEAAVLFESGSDKGLQKIITVIADAAIRTQWIMQRDPSLGETDIENRMKQQWSDEEKVKRSDFVIRNNPYALILPQVLAIHKALCVC